MIMNTTLYTADSRGYNDLGWLRSHHTFSFGHYFDPDRVHFGALRVFNDDTVIGGRGFGTHPHDNMEIISIPLEGTLMHRDSMGHEQGLRPGDVQVMSAGTGLTHSEYNGSADSDLKFLQIWVIPKVRNVAPRYDEVHLSDADGAGAFHTVVGPEGGGHPLFIHQDAYLSIARFEAGASASYALHNDANGTFTFVIEGAATVNGIALARRDAVGITDVTSIDVSAPVASTVITIEVPML
jgi:redox-sensitive bicupin YhaK (pirin superfamily)